MTTTFANAVDKKKLTLFFAWCWFELLKKRAAANARNKRYLQRHPERLEKRRRQCAVWRQENRERYLESARRSARKIYYTNPGKNIAYSKKWAQEHREQLNARLKVWRAKKQAADPSWRVGRCLRKRVWDAVRGISKKSASTQELVGCSAAELIAHLEKLFLPGMSWENYGKWHVDHIKPCSAFDLTDPGQQRVCFNHQNLQPLWALDNIRKGGVRAA
jgi:hypothetical protein